MNDFAIEALKVRNVDLSLELRRVADQERRRIAAVLHDGLAQDLVLIHMRLQGIQAADMAVLRGHAPMPPQGRQEMMQEIFSLLEEAIARTGELTSDLCPAALQSEGLGGGLAWLCRRVQAQRGVNVEYHETGAAADCPRDLASVLFAAARELLVNACKHGHPQRIEVRLDAGEEIVELEVSDNGQGFARATRSQPRREPGEQGWGLANLRRSIEDLGGVMEITDGKHASGTQVTVRVPRLVSEPILAGVE